MSWELVSHFVSNVVFACLVCCMCECEQNEIWLEWPSKLPVLRFIALNRWHYSIYIFKLDCGLNIRLENSSPCLLLNLFTVFPVECPFSPPPSWLLSPELSGHLPATILSCFPLNSLATTWKPSSEPNISPHTWASISSVADHIPILLLFTMWQSAKTLPFNKSFLCCIKRVEMQF